MRLTNEEINILMELTTDNPWFDIVSTSEGDHFVLDIEDHKIYELKVGLKELNDGLTDYDFMELSSKQEQIYFELLRRLGIYGIE